MRTAMRPWTMPCASALVALMIGAGSAGAAQTHDLTMTGSGIVTTETTADCEISGDGCVMDISGSLIGQSVGSSSFAATLTTYWLGTPDSSQCAPATGVLTVTAANNATVSVVLNGLTCDIDDDVSAQTFDGSFYVTGSTGNLSGLTGTGSLTIGWALSGDVKLLLHLVY